MRPQQDATRTEATPRPDQLALGTADGSEAVLSVLEADQLVVAKERTHLGRARLSLGVRVLLWGLRLYVVAMLIMVAMQVLNTIHLGKP